MKSIKTKPNSAKGPDKGKIVNKCNSTVKIWFDRKNILNYAYVLKNGVGRYNIFI